ncbi:MAG TPA: hypothetical protein VKB43_01675 [Gaiellaceae bacterium]|nr:hypothetical protein [Gaiellaceae bacterium]
MDFRGNYNLYFSPDSPADLTGGYMTITDAGTPDGAFSGRIDMETEASADTSTYNFLYHRATGTLQFSNLPPDFSVVDYEFSTFFSGQVWTDRIDTDHASLIVGTVSRMRWVAVGSGRLPFFVPEPEGGSFIAAHQEP